MDVIFWNKVIEFNYQSGDTVLWPLSSILEWTPHR